MPEFNGGEVVNYLLPIIGFLMVYVLNGIKKEITEVKGAVLNLSTEIVNLDKRVLTLEILKDQTNGHLRS